MQNIINVKTPNKSLEKREKICEYLWMTPIRAKWCAVGNEEQTVKFKNWKRSLLNSCMEDNRCADRNWHTAVASVKEIEMSSRLNLGNVSYRPVLTLDMYKRTDHNTQICNLVYRCTGWSKRLCAPDDCNTKTQCIPTIPTQLMIWRWSSQNTFGMRTVLYWTVRTVLYWTRPSRTQFGVSTNVWRLAGDTLNITCNFLYCNHQVHRDVLITLYNYMTKNAFRKTLRALTVHSTTHAPLAKNICIWFSLQFPC
jgi:hypothetical protein